MYWREKMTDENPIMGIKTKACVNGVYPDTIPTINQNISDIQDELGDGVVHITDDETVSGKKTFTDVLTVHGDEQNTKGTIVLSPVTQGANIQLKDVMNRSISIVQNHDSDNNCYLTEYPDNYYPVDENENPVAPSNATIMTSGLVAVDPRIVHTTGNEEISGQKTFTESLKTSGSNGTVTIDDSGRITYNQSNPNATAMAGLEYDDEQEQTYMYAPSYLPVDSDENPQVPYDDIVITSMNLAVDPRIVHTTGNETVAGNKTFTGIIDAVRLRRGYVACNMTQGTWWKVYTFTPTTYGLGCFIEIFNTSSLTAMHGCEIRIQIPNQNWTYNPSGNIFNSDNIIVGKIVKNANGNAELWVSKTTSGSAYLVFNIKYIGNITLIPVGTSGTEPIQGDDYPIVVNLMVSS